MEFSALIQPHNGLRTVGLVGFRVFRYCGDHFDDFLPAPLGLLLFGQWLFVLLRLRRYCLGCDRLLSAQRGAFEVLLIVDRREDEGEVGNESRAVLPLSHREWLLADLLEDDVNGLAPEAADALFAAEAHERAEPEAWWQDAVERGVVKFLNFIGDAIILSLFLIRLIKTYKIIISIFYILIINRCGVPWLFPLLFRGCSVVVPLF